MTTHIDKQITVEEIDAMSDEEFTKWIESWAADLDPEEYSQEAWEECIAEGRRKAAIKNPNPPSHFYDTLDEMFADLEAHCSKQERLAE